jgi:hypothetical protein
VLLVLSPDYLSSAVSPDYWSLAVSPVLATPLRSARSSLRSGRWHQKRVGESIRPTQVGARIRAPWVGWWRRRRDSHPSQTKHGGLRWWA